jgi:protein-tyrosine phosphatase
MSDFPPDEASEKLWGAPDFEGRTHARPLPDWVFASAWFNRPMTGRGIDMKWPDVGFYLDRSWSAAVLVCSPGFRPPFAQRPKGQIVVDPWPDLSAPRDPRKFLRALRWLLGQASEGRRVEIGCAGGHGRTGTTLAGLFVLQGLPP